MIINNKNYSIPVLTFNVVCELENYGIDFMNGKFGMQTVRGYLAYMGNMSLTDAGNQLEAHVSNGGDLEAFFTEITESINNSPFFQKKMKEQEQKATKPKAKQ